MAKRADEFRVPSLLESSPERAALIEKQSELQSRYGELNTRRALLRGEIEALKKVGGKRLAPAVAELLGDSPEGSIADLSRQLREVVREMGNIESAEEVLRRRLDESRDSASKVVCHAVRAEHAQRLARVCAAAKQLEAYREEYEQLLDMLDAEDVRKDFLQPVRAHFLGDRRGGTISYFLREVREAGHNV